MFWGQNGVWTLLNIVRVLFVLKPDPNYKSCCPIQVFIYLVLPSVRRIEPPPVFGRRFHRPAQPIRRKLNFRFEAVGHFRQKLKAKFKKIIFWDEVLKEDLFQQTGRKSILKVSNIVSAFVLLCFLKYWICQSFGIWLFLNIIKNESFCWSTSSKVNEISWVYSTQNVRFFF